MLRLMGFADRQPAEERWAEQGRTDGMASETCSPPHPRPVGGDMASTYPRDDHPIPGFLRRAAVADVGSEVMNLRRQPVEREPSAEEIIPAPEQFGGSQEHLPTLRPRRPTAIQYIAESIEDLRYGEMIDLAESFWKAQSEGTPITLANLPALFHRWAKANARADI
jgi:hypothetical protein